MKQGSTLDTDKYQDVITGTWQDFSTGYGSWTADGTDVQGLYQPSKRGNSVDLYLDINKNGIIDSGDKKIGFAAMATTSTGSQGTWNWSHAARRGDYFGIDGNDAGQIGINDKTFLKPGTKWDAVLGYLDTSKYQDVISGTWENSSSGYGSWTVIDTDVKGLYKPSKRGRSVDLYLDINKSGIVDASDKKIGFAATANTSTGGRGTWNWSATAKLGDYFGIDGEDAGQFSISNKNFLQTWANLT